MEKGFRFYGLTIDAGVEIPLAVSGNLVACMEASGAVHVGLDDEAAFPMERGIRVRVPDGAEFRNLRVKNSGAAAITVTLAVGYGELHDGRLTMTGGTLDSITSVGTVGTVTRRSAPFLVTLADIACATGVTTIFSVSTFHFAEMLITNLGTVTLRVGDNAVGAAQGIPLAGGQMLALSSRQNLYVYNPSAAAVTVARAYTRWDA